MVYHEELNLNTYQLGLETKLFMIEFQFNTAKQTVQTGIIIHFRSTASILSPSLHQVSELNAMAMTKAPSENVSLSRGTQLTWSNASTVYQMH